MKRHPSSFILHPSSLPHVLAWVVACATFPLIWMGGFVTTYRAGMAVPDWPSTFGYNMFLYPLESWLKVFDVFLEHSHRLVAASVGLLTIGLAVALWLGDRRRWVCWLGLIAVVGVSSQGVLGGLRVWFDERLLAKIHGCTAPLFFALTASLVTLTSGAWKTSFPRSVRAAGGEEAPLSRFGRGAGGEGWLAFAIPPVIYLQIVAGAQLRHLVAQEQTFWFALWVWIHVIAAGLLLCGILWIAICSGIRAGWHAQSLRWAWLGASDRSPRPSQSLRACHPIVRRARLLAVLMVLQLILGAATWVTNYGVPVWFTEYVWALDYTVVAGGAWQAVLTTAHVAVASLVLVTAISLLLWSSRLPEWEAEESGNEFRAGPCRPGSAMRMRDCEIQAGPTRPGSESPISPGSESPISPRSQSPISPGIVQRYLTALCDYCRLTRPGIVAMVLVTMSVAALVADPEKPHWPQLAHSLLGAALVISGAIALNQRLERTSDARMARTALRPLPSGRLTARQAVLFGIATSAAGMLYLVLLTPPTVAWLTAASWVVYVWIYTPLKTHSAWQTPLGAVAGAMPTLIGTAAAGVTPTGVMPLALFGIVYCWQFPHAMAIAWLHRADFAAANLRLATVVDPSGRIAARLALAGAAALLPVSAAPCFDGRVGWGYTAAALLLGLAYFGCAVAFYRRTVDANARALLWASLVYLPAICAALVWAVWG